MADFLKSLKIKGIEIDPAGATTDQVLTYNGTKFVPGAGGGGGASVTVSDTPPLTATVGDLWYESDTGKTFVYYDLFWVEVGGGAGASVLDGLNDVVLTSPTNGQVLKYNGTNWVNGTDDAGTTITSLDDIGNVTVPSPSSGDFLKWNGSAWVNDAIDLSTDTTGSYVASLVAGTGVTLTNNSGEGATPTIAIGQAVNTTSNVTFNDVIVSGNLTVNGTTTTLNTENLLIEDNIVVLNSNVTTTPTLNAGIEVERGTSTNTLIRWNETSDKWELTNDGSTYGNIISTADSGTVTGAMLASNAVALGTQTTGDYVSSLVAGTGITLTNNTGESATPTVAVSSSLIQKVNNSMTYLICEVGP